MVSTSYRFTVGAAKAVEKMLEGIDDIDRVEIPDRRWTVGTTRPCQFPRCRTPEGERTPAVACFRPYAEARGSRRFIARCYCVEHMHRGRIVDGRVLVKVGRGSPAAERGYLD